MQSSVATSSSPPIELGERQRERPLDLALDREPERRRVERRRVVGDPGGGREGVAGERVGLVGAGEAPLGARQAERARERALHAPGDQRAEPDRRPPRAAGGARRRRGAAGAWRAARGARATTAVSRAPAERVPGDHRVAAEREAAERAPRPAREQGQRRRAPSTASAGGRAPVPAARVEHPVADAAQLPDEQDRRAPRRRSRGRRTPTPDPSPPANQVSTPVANSSETTSARLQSVPRGVTSHSILGRRRSARRRRPPSHGRWSSAERLFHTPAALVWYKARVLVRRLSDAAVTEVHGLRPHILMDAGELGSRNLSVNWLEVPPGRLRGAALPRGGRAGLRRRQRHRDDDGDRRHAAARARATWC